MPSNSTKNLGLSQWEGNDNLRREDLNADNKKIDDAVEGINQVASNQANKIQDINTDISGINEEISDINTAISERVVKVEGKDLSTEDYTTAEKNKLTNIDDDANNYSHPATHSANMIETTSTKRFITDVLLAKLNGIEAWVAGLYEPIIAKKSGFNLDKSDSVSSTSSVLLATAKAVKTAYDKAVSALNVANSKEPIISKKSGFNLDKSDSVSSTSSSILATLRAVKTAYDKAVSAYNLAASKLGATATAVNANKYKNREDVFHPDNYGKVITISSSVTLNSSHVNKVLRFTNSSNIVVTIPKNLTANGKIALVRAGAGKVTTATASGMTLNSIDSKRSIKDRFALNVLMFNSLTNADLFGSLE